MKLKVGTRVRDKETGVVGTIIEVSDFIGLCYVDTDMERVWIKTERLEAIEEK